MVFDYFKAKRMLKMPIYLSEDYPLRTIKLQSLGCIDENEEIWLMSKFSRAITST